MSQCLNCRAELHGRFCSACGQRVIPRYPTVREMAADAWHEFTGWDGRFARTLKMLTRPGALTVEVLEGRRARYVSPLRLYLAASVIYFLAAATIPNLSPGRATVQLGDRTFILTQDMRAEERAELLQRLEKAPWLIQALIRPSLDDFQSVQTRFRDNFPRALFVLVPIFAGIIALFYRRRRFVQHLIFGLHVHTAVFLVLATAHVVNITGSRTVRSIVGWIALLVTAVYLLKAFRRVYGDSWRWIVLKSAAIGVVYFVAIAFAILVTYAWAVLT